MPQPTNDAFFDAMMDWSDRKLRILTAYLEGAARILTSFTQLDYVDGFAGMGIYRDGSEGSPVRAAKMAQQNKVAGKKATFRCINVEENEEYFANLQSSTAAFGSEVLNLPGTFAANVDRILREAKGHAIVGFLDPFGIEGVDWDAVLKLINRPERTDLLIRFNPLTVRRMWGFFDSPSGRSSQKPGTLCGVYGLSAAELRRLLDGPTPEARMQQAIDLYEQKLADAFASKARSVGGFAATYVVKSLDGTPKGHLVFAAAHPKAANLMSDVVYNAEKSYQRDVAEYTALRPRQLGMFDDDPTEKEISDEIVDRLKEDIWRACQGESLDRLGVFMTVFTKWFGRIANKHLNAALNAMRQPADGRIIAATGATSNDDTVFTFRAPVPESVPVAPLR